MMPNVTLAAPWLIVDLGQPMQTIGWTIRNGGIGQSRHVLWRAVRNEDLSADFDVGPWLAQEADAVGHPDAPVFLTSARIADYAVAHHRVEGITATCVATAGLGNAETVGYRRWATPHVGTINVLVAVDCALTLPAQLELISLITEARTAAVIARQIPLADGIATGTGTDCICLASAVTGPPHTAAGKHTALGETAGRAALTALTTVAARWQDPSAAQG